MIQQRGELKKKKKPSSWFKQLVQVEYFRMPGIQPLDLRALEFKCFRLRPFHTRKWL